MAITAEARTDIIALVVGMFDAAPGATYLSQFVNAVDNGSTIETLAADLTGTGAFTGTYPNLQTANEFATKFVNSIASEAGASAKAWAVTWIEAQLNGGATKAEVIVASINALRATDEADANWGNAAAALNNKVEVAEWYSVDQLGNATDLATLQNQISTVTSDDATVTAITDGSAQSGGTFVLTTGVDAVTGTAGNDTILGNSNADGNTTLTALDSIDGGDGVDTLSVTDVNANLDIPASANVTNVETAEFTLAGTFGAADGDVSGWTGLTSLSVDAVGAVTAAAAATTDVTVETASLAAANVAVDGGKDVSVTATGQTTGTITVGGTTAAAGTVAVTADTAAAAVQGAIDVTGGTTVAVTTTTSNAVNTTATQSDVTVTGDANTTAVTVTQDAAATAAADVVGKVNGAIVVDDVNAASGTDAGTIATVTLNNYGAASTIDSSALTTVNLSGTGADLTIGRGALTETPTANTLALNLDGLTTTGAITDDEAAKDDGFTTLNITTSGDDSTVASLVAADATDLNVSGTAALTLAANTLGALTDVTVSGSAGLTADLSASAVETFNASATSGDNAVTLDGTTAELAVTGGTGADAVTVMGALDADAVVNLGEGDDTYTFTTAAAAGASVDAGAGNDTIAINNGALLDAAAANVYSNFETLEIAGGQGAYDMSRLSLTDVKLTDTAVAAPASITEATAGTTVTFGATEADGGTASVNLTAAGLSYALADATGAADSVAIILNADDSGEDQTAEGQVTAALQANDIESVSIESNATTASEESAAGAGDALTEADYVNTFTLDADAVETLTLTGDAQVNVTTSVATTALTQVNATGNTAGVTVDLSNGTAGAVTFNGSAADDTVATSGSGDLVQGNAGEDSVSITAGASTVVRYAATSDSQLTLTDTSDPADDVADTATGFDDVTGFLSGTDLIELSSDLGLATGDARADILQKGAMAGTTAANIETFIGDGVDFFSTGLVDRAVAVSSAGGNSYVFIDANNDGNFTQGDDMFIELTGTAALTVADFTFG